MIIKTETKFSMHNYFIIYKFLINFSLLKSTIGCQGFVKIFILSYFHHTEFVNTKEEKFSLLSHLLDKT